VHTLGITGSGDHSMDYLQGSDHTMAQRMGLVHRMNALKSDIAMIDTLVNRQLAYSGTATAEKPVLSTAQVVNLLSSASVMRTMNMIELFSVGDMLVAKKPQGHHGKQAKRGGQQGEASAVVYVY